METQIESMPAHNPLTASIRLHYLDWLRVLAILAIFFFHTTRFFDTDDWTIKNATTYHFVDAWKDFADSWGMPLILLISGASVFYALGKTSAGKYVKGILARLFLPLMLGIFTHVAFQVYLERLNKRSFSGSFLDFYPHYFEGMYGFGGNFAWMGLHLWYLELLFILSMIFLPLFVWLKRTSSGGRVLQALGDILALPGGLILFALPVFLLIINLDTATWGNRDLGGWSILIYPCFFISGFVIISNPRLQDRIREQRWAALVSGVILSSAYLYAEYSKNIPAAYSFGGKLDDGLRGLSVWCWLLAVFGFGMQHLNSQTPFLKYANQAVLPFYILHQTVIVCLGYFVVQWAIPDLLKFALILIVSFLITIGLYEFLVRRFNLLRFLFGMKLLIRANTLKDIEAPSPAPVH
jgi:glucan biosynthesis protein C